MRTINNEGLKLYYWNTRGHAGASHNKASEHRYFGKSIKKERTPISTNKWLLIGATVVTAAIVGLFFLATKANSDVKQLNGTASQLRKELQNKQQNVDELKKTQEELRQNVEKQIEDLNKRVDALVTRESGWRVNATNASSGAYGIPQSLPGSKMASAGADWQTNPVTQLRWMTGYVNARYGGFCQANSFQLRNNWY